MTANQLKILIENVVTHTEQRRRGAGRAVVEAAIQHSWDAGCYKILLLSGIQSSETHAFYEAVGFDKNSKQGFVIYR